MFKTIKIIIASFCLSACVSQPFNINMHEPPEKDEKSTSILEERLGDAGFYYILLTYKLVDDVKTINRLNSIGARIAAYTERSQIHYRYFIVDSTYRNVFSLSNGYIIFTKGFIQDIDQEDVLAAVIAHEMAHVTHKHSVSEYQRIMGRSLSSIIGEKVFDVATDIHIRRAYELQADQTGIRYVYRAGYDPNAIVHLLEKLKIFEQEDKIRFEKERDQNPKDNTELNKKLVPDHPDTENRIVNARNYIQEVIKTEEVQYVPEQFQF
ncbi:TPR repeat-containing protein YfgC precursor [bacterium BMS3Bbin09]|nr:TPR repeat-containing protein YfgC precursor [bacterium BMS3Bbin09]